MAEAMDWIGKSTPRIDGLERVTGRADFSPDISLPDMLYARVLRSPHPHARIRSIDVSGAEGLEGVELILTHENCRLVWSSGDRNNTRYLFNNPVRFVGEPVAAVVATDRHLAEEALKRIRVDYAPTEFVLDAEQALKPGAVEVQPGGNLSPLRTPDGPGERIPEIDQRGDLQQGFGDSDLVVEDHYRSKHHNNAQMEPRTAIARWEQGKLTVWTPTQGIANCRRDLARDLKLAPEKVRVICHYMGGGFGNKNQCQDSDLLAAEMAKRTGRPVKLELTRKEDFLGVHGRWPTSQYYKVGVKKDGTLQAIHLRSYSGMGPYRKSSGGVYGVELYRCPHVRREIYPVLTNMAVGGNYRAPAYPQGVYGISSVMDEIAHQLKMNPLDFHLKNVTKKYRDETPYTTPGMVEACLRKGAELFGWGQRWRQPAADRGPLKRGVGLAIGAFGARLGRSSAVLRLDSAGTVWVHVGVTDVGTGAKTTMALLTAEAMDVEADRVQVVWGDTDRCPYSVGESGSRTTSHTGYAILQAAEDLKQQMKDKGMPKGDQVWIAEATPEPKLKGFARYSFCAHFVEVEVDSELGSVRTLDYLAVHDCGRVINPLTATSQVQGGVIQGIGMALHEELLYDQNTGIPLNPGYYGARVMTHLDAPKIQVHFIEEIDAHGAFGAKSVGEPPIVPVVGAISNAVFNAIGARIKELPISRDKIIGVAS